MESRRGDDVQAPLGFRASSVVIWASRIRRGDELLTRVAPVGIQRGGEGVVDWDCVALPIDVLREVAVLHRQCRHALEKGLADSLAETFVAEEEKRLVAPVVGVGNVDGTADVAAVLVLVEGPTITNEEVTGVQMRVAQI